ncbi:MAG: GYF domain-containing protein [Aeoliella sp.]
MGIRFVCPNGHPLHVKLELAGKRGICPQCQAKFLIPVPNGSATTNSTPATAQNVAASPSVAQAASSPATAPSTVQPAQQPATSNSAASLAAVPPVASSPVNSNATEPVAPAPVAAPSERASGVPMWYVRPAAGGQFGPVDEQQIKQWATEGRVGADAYVWRTGWPDWRRATDAAEFFPRLAPATTETAKEPVDEGAPASAAVARYQRRKKQSAQGQAVAAIVLIVLALALAGVLVWVLQMTSANNEPTPQPEVAPPVTAPAE